MLNVGIWEIPVGCLSVLLSSPGETDKQQEKFQLILINTKYSNWHQSSISKKNLFPFCIPKSSVYLDRRPRISCKHSCGNKKRCQRQIIYFWAKTVINVFVWVLQVFVFSHQGEIIIIWINKKRGKKLVVALRRRII